MRGIFAGLYRLTWSKHATNLFGEFSFQEWFDHRICPAKVPRLMYKMDAFESSRKGSLLNGKQQQKNSNQKITSMTKETSKYFFLNHFIIKKLNIIILNIRQLSSTFYKDILFALTHSPLYVIIVKFIAIQPSRLGL